MVDSTALKVTLLLNDGGGARADWRCWDAIAGANRSCLRLLRKEGVDLVGRHASHSCSLGGIAGNTSFIAAVRDPKYLNATLGPSLLSCNSVDFKCFPMIFNI